jgi:uncharacterized protein YceK
MDMPMRRHRSLLLPILAAWLVGGCAGIDSLMQPEPANETASEAQVDAEPSQESSSNPERKITAGG